MKTIVFILAIVASANASAMCFFKYERTSGLNKICVYSCPDGERAITVKSYDLCPISL